MALMDPTPRSDTGSAAETLMILARATGCTTTGPAVADAVATYRSQPRAAVGIRQIAMMAE